YRARLLFVIFLVFLIISSRSDRYLIYYLLFFLTDPGTTAIYTLSLHDALPILGATPAARVLGGTVGRAGTREGETLASVTLERVDRKSTRLNSSHVKISYAVFCLKKKIKQPILPDQDYQDVNEL